MDRLIGKVIAILYSEYNTQLELKGIKKQGFVGD
jgi:hypothetical protein